MNLTKQFFKYVSQNIFGLIGTSCYILADTYFIAQAAGTDGVTLLNLCLPMYNLIFAFGSMIGLGAATRYAILQAQGEARAQRFFSNAILCACLIAIPFMLAGAFCPGTLLQLMGGDADIVALGLNYTRIFLLFTPSATISASPPMNRSSTSGQKMPASMKGRANTSAQSRALEK